MSGAYSIWLMPDAESRSLLQPVHERLCRQFAAPRFDLHLTLLGGRAGDAAQLKAVLPQIAAGIAPFRTPVKDVRTSEAFFQSFYALFEAQGSVLALKERTMRLAVNEDVGAFMPHVSLLYGPVEAAAKAQAADEARQILTGLPLRFEAITLALSSETIPIQDWRIEAVERLR